MDVELDLHQTFTTVEGVELICYERTDRFAFLCPYNATDEGSVVFKINETSVYPLNLDGQTPIEAIESFEITADEIEKFK